jgi:hypothetical protein
MTSHKVQFNLSEFKNCWVQSDKEVESDFPTVDLNPTNDCVRHQ